MAKELTNDLKLLFESINKEEEEELVNDQELGSIYIYNFKIVILFFNQHPK